MKMPRHSKTKIKKSRRSTPKKSSSKVQVEHDVKEGKGRRSATAEFCHQRKLFARYVSSEIKGSILRALVCLYEELNKPDDAIGYITSVLGADIPSEDELIKIQTIVQELRDKIERLEESNSELYNKINEVEDKAKRDLQSAETIGEVEEEYYYPASKSNLGNIEAKSCVSSTLGLNW